MKERGLFITIEGPDGSGKSTILKGINEWLDKVFKKPYLITKEPGSPHDEACVKMREMLLDPELEIAGEAELFLMIADRYQHVSNVVVPALNENKLVISDRYYDSTYAYQGWGRRKGEPEVLKYIEYLNERATMGLIPDLTILVTVDPKIGMKRTSSRDGENLDTFEKEKLDFRERVCYGFMDLYKKKNKDREFFIIDSTEKSEQQCLAEVIDYLSNFLEKKINLGG